MKKLVFAIAALVLAAGLSLPMATPAAAQEPVEPQPTITLTKTGPAAIFQSVPAEYTYKVINTGNVTLLVTLTDDQAPEIVGPEGDDGNSLLDPGEEWTYTTAYLIECTGITEMEHVNTATAIGTTETGPTTGNVTASWTVIVFQWQPRTIGYWGNWDNHWTDECMTDLVSRVNEQSAYFNDLTPEDVHDILLAPEQKKGKMNVTKATTLLVKQLLAAWLNVKSYEGATDSDNTTCGSLDAALRPDATVYFDEQEKTVSELLQDIEADLAADPDFNTLLEWKDILDDINNAEDNGYMMFMSP